LGEVKIIVFSLCAASRMWVRHRSVVIVQEVQETLASEEEYKQGTQRSASKEQEVVRAEARQGEEERVLQKGPEVLRPSYQVVAFASLRKPQE